MNRNPGLSTSASSSYLVRSASFAAVAVTVVLVRIALDLAHYPHARAVYVFGLYAAVFPTLVWLWSTGPGDATVFPIPDCRVPLVAGFALLAAAVGFSYDHGHTISDESSYLFQARIFASNNLKAEPLPGATDNPANTPSEIYFEQQIDSTRGWFSKYTPAWPLALALGELLHCPWLVNPVLGVVLLLLMNHLSRPWGVPAQALSLLVAGTSAYMMLYSVGFMSHGFAAVTGAAAIAALFHSVRTERLGGMFVGYFFVILGTEIRPYTGAVIALLCVGYTVHAFWRKPHLLWPAVAIIAGAGLVSAGLFCVISFIYTGSPLVTPYAYSRGLAHVDNMTLNPVRIVHNIVTIWRPAAMDTLWSTFPFVIVAAAYACRYERKYRRELICLALLFPMLVAAHLLQNEPSASLDGERYYYEGYALLCIVGARGFILLVSRWRIRAQQAACGLAVLFAIQAVFLVVAIRDVEESLQPWRSAYRSSLGPPVRSLVFLSGDEQGFASKHANWNDADWKAARVLFLNDPGPERRDEVACRFSRPEYRVVSYDAPNQRAISRNFTAVCPASRPSGL